MLSDFSDPGLSFLLNFDYAQCWLVCRLKRAVLARSSSDLVPSLAFTTDRAISAPFSSTRKDELGRSALAQETSGGQEVVRWEFDLWGQ